MNLPRQNFARIKTLTSLYADAAQRGYDDYLDLNDRIAAIGEVEYHPDLLEFGRRRDISGIQTIVFSAMSFESAIFEYSADHLGDAYVQEHLDKLDTLSKWVLALRLIAGYEIQKDRAPYAALKELITARNRLVHSKSEPIDFERIEVQLARIQRDEDKHDAGIRNAYKALVLMSMELEARLGPTNNPLPSYDPKMSLLLRIPPRLQPLVAECRKIIQRNLDASQENPSK